MNMATPSISKRKKARARHELTKHQQLVDKAFGMFAFVPTSSEEFAKRKQEEIDLEERRRK